MKCCKGFHIYAFLVVTTVSRSPDCCFCWLPCLIQAMLQRRLGCTMKRYELYVQRVGLMAVPTQPHCSATARQRCSARGSRCR